MVPLYRYFSRHWEGLDYSDDSLYDLYMFETFGQGKLNPDNGFANGKKWMDVTVSMWLEDLGKILWKSELYDDNELPDWWLDKVLK